MKNFLLGIIVALLVIIGGGAFLAMRGYINLRADQTPSALETKIAMAAMDASAARNAPDQKNPVAPTEENLVAGARIFLNHCAGCHGLPANPDTAFAKSFYPPVPEFFKDPPDMPENENFYIVQHGVRFTGMPAWNNTLNENEIWQVVTFLASINKLPPAAQKELQFAPPLSIGAPPAR
ncbi:MAG: c-type cytochrome [Candidatus Acidiferrales bacterium]